MATSVCATETREEVRDDFIAGNSCTRNRFAIGVSSSLEESLGKLAALPLRWGDSAPSRCRFIAATSN